MDQANFCYANETVIIENEIMNNPFYFTTFYIALFNNILISFLILIYYKFFANIIHRKLRIECIKENKFDYETLKKLRSRTLKSASSPISTYSPLKSAYQMDVEDLQQITTFENRSSSQEDPNSYNVGGYMPIQATDLIGGRYEIVRKLGYGHFSTVWLCQNRMSDEEYVAIKVSKANSKQNSIAREEIKLFQCTNTKNINHLGYHNIVRMFDFFTCHSANGQHTALVLEVMGPSLLHLIRLSEYKGIQLMGVKKIITQVLKGLMYLHEECQIIHTDIKPENILIKAKDLYIREMVETAKRFKQLGIALPKTYIGSNHWEESSDESDGESAKLSRSTSCPEDPFLSDLVNYRKTHPEQKLLGPMWIESGIEVKIADMGNACFRDRKYTAPAIQTRQYRAIEVILDAGWDYPADMWSVGCMAFELATGEYLFYPRAYPNVSLDMDHLALVWETLGGIPDYVATRGGRAHEFFSETGALRHISTDQIRIWRVEDVLVDKYKWRKVDAILFADFINSLIEPDQSLRCTARDGLNSAWIIDE